MHVCTLKNGFHIVRHFDGFGRVFTLYYFEEGEFSFGNFCVCQFYPIIRTANRLNFRFVIDIGDTVC